MPAAEVQVDVRIGSGAVTVVVAIDIGVIEEGIGGGLAVVRGIGGMIEEGTEETGEGSVGVVEAMMVGTGLQVVVTITAQAATNGADNVSCLGCVDECTNAGKDVEREHCWKIIKAIELFNNLRHVHLRTEGN